MGSKTISDDLHERIAKARESAGFSLTEAARKSGFKHYQILSSIEKGTRNINANELIRLSRLYGRSLDYFFGQEVPNEPTPLWRKTENIDIQKVQRHFLSFLEKYTHLEGLLGLKRRWTEIRSSFDRDDFKNNEFKAVERLAEDILKKLDLGLRPECNLLNVLENNLRFKILHWPLQQGVSGASVVDDSLGVGILVNRHDAPWRRNYDLAHELFHVVTWKVFTPEEIGNGTKKTKPEQYADVFASSLLLPAGHLLDALKEISTNKEIKKVDIIELAKDFGVSTEAILWRLVNLKKLTRPAVQKILTDPDFRNLDRLMRQGFDKGKKPSKFPARYVSLACRCLMEGKISRGTFAEYLEINRAEIDDHLAEMGFANQNYEKIASA
jgi:Zn-dependent peptidase ImmA (M78 family)